VGTSSISAGFNRISYNDTIAGGQTFGTTDNALANLSLPFHRLPVTLSANYTDNLFGNLQQQLISNGETPLANFASPVSRSITATATTFYTILPNLIANGFVTRTEDYIAGQSFGLTQVGLNASYNVLKRLKGLTVLGGLVDQANQQGNTRIGLVGRATYRRSVHRWETSVFAAYDQNTETLLATYTTSNINWGGDIRREFRHGFSAFAGVNANHSAFVQQSGDGNTSEGIFGVVRWHFIVASANYSKSSGTSLLTTNGLVGVPLPSPLVSNVILYNGTSRGLTLNTHPTRDLSIATSYSKTDGSTLSPTLFSNNTSTVYYGLATYQLRKLLLTAGATKYVQSLSGSGTPPVATTAYFFGITRWFKAF
jgi:hypothetical protein